MIPPAWKTCTENELWLYVSWHLAAAGIQTVLVGGAVVAIYTEGLYRSGDLDIVPDSFTRSRIPEVMRSLGFIQEKSRYYKHPECSHLFLDFPQGPVELGEEYPVVPDQIHHEGQILRLLSPTDCVKDRLAAYIHWQSRAGFRQALLVCRRQADRVDLEKVRLWCETEGGLAAFDELLQYLQSSTDLTNP
ncbi:MAG: hypothetical protein QM680_08875 [Luteolibacter sp.]